MSVSQEVSFGDPGIGQVCWFGGEEIKDDKVSSFILSSWKKKEISWSSLGSSEWQVSCLSQASEKWVLAVQGDGKEYLGLCGENHFSQSIFLKKIKDGQNKLTVEMCVGDCFQPSTGNNGGIKQWTNEKAEKWKKLRFQKL